ncbi:MAG TPA: hypothetical protein VKN36_02775 [Eudoraea sp.]|nr:hypothetical protein [Eudoraea sp.]
MAALISKGRMILVLPGGVPAGLQVLPSLKMPAILNLQTHTLGVAETLFPGNQGKTASIILP